MASTIRLVTYNVHKCRGWDRRVSPERIARVLAPLDADCIALQEVVDGSPVGRLNQAQAFGDALGGKYKVVFGRTRELRASNYGTATLTRLQNKRKKNKNISWKQSKENTSELKSHV